MSYPLIPTNRFRPKEGEVAKKYLDDHDLVTPGEEVKVKHKTYRDDLIEQGLGRLPDDNNDTEE